MGICPAYVSKHKSNCEKQVILLIIPNGCTQHYLKVKKVSALLKRITSKQDGDFYVWIVFIASKQNTNLSQKKVCENKDFCYVVMRSEDIKIVEFTKYNKYDKVIIIFMQIFNV